ncbi:MULTISPECIES: L-serine ammonia-lyase, iron-sulfur-dependent subunit beta [Reichenbachiella]|uniref:L-serine dehydratase n=1 Tax=Reichenbachiella agariperforans TaxID=156994 RepID=A0A1M6VIH1_REIAG|nr:MULTISPECIES: L-serine ammonia-lyase, iron-sulfur-dependent subunit beta [Reichenbachiella]MBU2914435.1 L-serine ammonia-lyase, iron-sulfur-dependent subunit beta [Reichenbachiella agariperforans]RJE75286.1 L-serine dehydratase, iron-sulfur-dependent subunit beta [Reichenbachiella sp. MSK19-1]SHK81144.1 L-serine dehydratase [Reichenbachiella agariperforans]
MERSSVFDMIGPVMIGPSSSHTAGVVRIGRVGVKLLGGVPDEAEIIFYNSFAQTYEGHGSDRAIVAGLMDFDTDDARIKDAFDHAKDKLTYKFRSVGNASTKHPNTVFLRLKKGDKKIELEGESRGGGVIRISNFNGFASGFTANLHTLVVTTDDAQGSIAFISDIISHDDCNIATMTVSRKGKNDVACQIIEMDSGINDITLQYIRHIKWVHDVIYIPVI